MLRQSRFSGELSGLISATLGARSQHSWILNAAAGPSRKSSSLQLQSRNVHSPRPSTSNSSHRWESALLSAAPIATSPIPESLTSILLSSPIPAGWTVILLTLFARSAITLPVTLWQRRRLKRTREFVIPEMKRYNESIALSLARESRKAGKSYEEYRKTLKDQLATYQRSLHKKWKTHPLPTILIPLGVHIPLLIGLSLTIRSTVEVPGGWATESWGWLQALGESDGTGILPIVGGLVAFANAEAVSRKSQIVEEAISGPQTPQRVEAESADPSELNKPSSPASSPNPTPLKSSPSVVAKLPSQLSRPIIHPPQSRSISTSQSTMAIPRPRAKRPSASSSIPSTGALTATKKPPLTTMESQEVISSEKRKSQIRTAFITNVMRIGAVLFIPIASQVPSALALYWTTSMIYTFLQNLYLNRLDSQDLRRT